MKISNYCFSNLITKGKKDTSRQIGERSSCREKNARISKYPEGKREHFFFSGTAVRILTHINFVANYAIR